MKIIGWCFEKKEMDLICGVTEACANDKHSVEMSDNYFKI